MNANLEQIPHDEGRRSLIKNFGDANSEQIPHDKGRRSFINDFGECQLGANTAW